MSTAVSATGDKKLEIWLQNEVVCSLQFLTFVGHARMLHLILWPIPRLYFPFSGKTCPAFGPSIILCQWQTCAKLLQRNLLTVKIWSVSKRMCVCVCIFRERANQVNATNFTEKISVRVCVCVWCWHAFNFSTVNCLCA